MNMMQMIQQAQTLQKRLKDAQEELLSAEVTGEKMNGAIKVVCDGAGKLKSLKLSAELLNPEHPELVDEDTLETLEDLIVATVSETSNRATEEMKTKLKDITGGINIPGLT